MKKDIQTGVHLYIKKKVMFEQFGIQLLSYIFSPFSATRKGEEDMDREASKHTNEEYKK